MSDLQPAPGWYADPQPGPPGSLRWWDGQRWTPHATAPHDPRAGWWTRAGAWAIDAFIVGAASVVVSLPVQTGLQDDLRVEQQRLSERLVDGTGDGALADYWSAIVQAYAARWLWLAVLPVVLALAYHLVMLRTRSATVGKRSLGLRVTAADGEGRPSWLALVVRVVVQFGPGWLLIPLTLATGSFTVFALLGTALFAWQLLDPLWAAGPSRRALHDLIAGTRVVRDR